MCVHNMGVGGFMHGCGCGSTVCAVLYSAYL